jgi:hypothetical protein
MPARALYYPEWSISDAAFLAEALLYWDRLSVIVPEENFSAGVWHPDERTNRLFNKLHEEFVTPIVPNDAQKTCVHERLSRIFESDVAPTWFRPENLQPDTVTTLAADKFSSATMEMLQEHKWARESARIDRIRTYNVSLAAANVVMAALANECSSGEMPPITRDAGGFVANCNSLLQELKAPQGLALGERLGPAVERPVESDLAFLLARVPHIGLRPQVTAYDLERVIEARRDPDVNSQRQAFVSKVDAYLDKLRGLKGGERNVLRDQFVDELNMAIAKLKRELSRVGLRTVFSKEGLCALLIGAAAETLVPTLGLVVGLTGGLLDYRQKRREVLEKNWAAWAFGLRQTTITLV